MNKRRIAALLAALFILSTLTACKPAVPEPVTDTDPIVIGTDSVPDATDSKTSDKTNGKTTNKTSDKTSDKTDSSGTSDKEAFTPDPNRSLDWCYDVAYPEITVSTMTKLEPDLDDFTESLDLCRSLYRSNTPKNAEPLKKALCKAYSGMLSFYTAHHVWTVEINRDQADGSAPIMSELYSSLGGEAYDMLEAFVDEARRQNYCLLYLINDFASVQMGGEVSSLSSAAKPYAQEINSVKAEYQALANGGTEAQILALYQRYLKAGRLYAANTGNASYYDYLTQKTYQRDYGKTEREAFRTYVKEYLVPLYRQLKAKSKAVDNSLTYKEFALSDTYLESSYKTVGENYLFSYFQSLPASAGSAMKSAFDKDRIVIATKSTANPIAYVTVVGDTPICYFHQSDLSMITVSHELGHYYYHTMDPDNKSFDLMEAHSQANSLLLIRHLDGKLNQKAYEGFRAYALMDVVYQIVCGTIKDEFDEAVLTDPKAETYSVAQLEAVMNGLIAEYGVADFSSNIVSQLTTYWRRQEISQMGYYLSYATSGVVALQVYQKSLTDYAGATECYRKLAEQVDPNSTFLGTVSSAGLRTPFDPSAYTALQSLGK